MGEDAAPAPDDEAPTAVPLLAPRDGLPPVIDTSTRLVDYA